MRKYVIMKKISNSDQSNPIQKEVETSEIENYELTANDYAAIYARKSSSQNQGYSIETQVSSAIKKANEKRLLIYDVYQEEKSSTKYPIDGRLELSRLLRDAKEGRFKTVIVFKRDRLARVINEYLEIKKTFVECGINMLFTCESEFVGDGSIMSNLIENIIIGIANYEVDVTGERTKLGRENARKEGIYYAKETLMVYKKSERNGKSLIILKDDYAAPLVDRLFDEYIKAEKTNNIIKELYSEIKKRYRTKEEEEDEEDEEDGEEEEEARDTDSYLSFIRSPSIAGIQIIDINKGLLDTFKYNGGSKKHEIDKSMYQDCTNIERGAVSPEKWYQAMNIWRAQYKPTFLRNKNYPFSDRLYCKKCGQQIKLKSDDNYCCTNKHHCISIPKKDLEDNLKPEILRDIYSKKYIRDRIENIIRELKDDKTEIEKNLYKIKNNQRAEISELVQSDSRITDSSVLIELVKQEVDEKDQRKKVSLKLEKYYKYLELIVEIYENAPRDTDNLKNKKYVQGFFSNILEKVDIIGAKQFEITYRRQ
jgi:site-specific DNA recombinase